MAKGGKWSGVLTLRIPPEVHEDLALTASELGLDITGLIRLLIRRGLPHYQLEGRMLAVQGAEAHEELDQWRREHPGRPIREFWDHYYLVQWTKWQKDLRKLGHDPRMTMDEAMGKLEPTEERKERQP